MSYDIVRSEDYDWIALYHDGILLHQGHSIQEEDLLRILGIDFGHQVLPLAEMGECPHYLRDLEERS